MATRQMTTVGRIATAPSVVILFIWMIVPLAMTIWFSLQRYSGGRTLSTMSACHAAARSTTVAPAVSYCESG